MDTNAIRRNASANQPRRFNIARSACSRCGGRGGFEGWPGFTCFRCQGECADPTNFEKGWEFPASWDDERIIAWIERHEAKRIAAAAKRDADRIAKANAVWNANLARCPQLAEIVDTDNDFLADMVRTARRFELSDKQIAAIPTAIARSIQAAADRDAAETAAQTAGHLGEIGERLDIKVTVQFVKSFDGQYGTSYLVKMITDEGHVLSTWASGAFGYETYKGDVLEIRATVKDHDEYQGTPETKLTRCKTTKTISTEED